MPSLMAPRIANALVDASLLAPEHETAATGIVERILADPVPRWRIENAQFVLDGRPTRIRGANLLADETIRWYYATHGYPEIWQEVIRIFKDAADLGCNVIRLMPNLPDRRGETVGQDWPWLVNFGGAVPVEPYNWDGEMTRWTPSWEDYEAMMDTLYALADEYDLYIYLTPFDGGPRSAWNVQYPMPLRDEGFLRSHALARRWADAARIMLTDHPRLMGCELVNEWHNQYFFTMPDAPGDRSWCYSPAAFLNFADFLAREIRAINENILLSPGLWGADLVQWLNTGGGWRMFESLTKAPGWPFDHISIHDYRADPVHIADDWGWTRRNTAAALPMLMSECGPAEPPTVETVGAADDWKADWWTRFFEAMPDADTMFWGVGQYEVNQLSGQWWLRISPREATAIEASKVIKASYSL